MYQQTYEHEQYDRQTPDSDGLGSSIATSPAPSCDDSNLVSPVQQTHYYSSPYVNYQYPYYQNNSYYQSFNDSNYYSRNNSMYQYPVEHLNQSQVKPVEKKPFLKFSIEAILGLNNETKQEELEASVQESFVEESKKVVRKKRARKSAEINSNKRMRTIFTQDQLDKLEVEFLRQQYMVGSERSYLANSLGLSESQVKIWFQNRRIKWRKSQNGMGGDGKQDDDYLNQSCSNESFNDE